MIVPAVDRTIPAVATYWCGVWDVDSANGGIDLTRRRSDFVDDAWYAVACIRLADDAVIYGAIIQWPPRRDVFPTTTVPGLAEFTIKSLPLASPTLTAQPPLDKQVIGFETWYAAPSTTVVERSAQAGGFWATAQARPIELRLDFGDGSPAVSCALPVVVDPTGRPACARHTYLDHRLAPDRNGNFRVTASYVYEIWLATNEQPALAFVELATSPPVSVAATARQVQAVIN